MQAPLLDWITDSIGLVLKFIFVMIMSFGSFINFSLLASCGELFEVIHL